MSYNFKIGELKESARYTVSTIDKWDGSTKTEEMSGASLKRFTNGCAHLYDIHAEEIAEEAPTEATGKAITPGAGAKLNPLCKQCAKLGRTCHGTENRVWTGCVRYTAKLDELESKKAAALAEYRSTRTAWINDPTDANWRNFCDAKRVCRLLGCLI